MQVTVMGKKTLKARKRIEQGNFSQPSPQQIIEMMTPRGAWTAAQLAEWGVPWPPTHGWRRDLIERWYEIHARQQSEITR
jgi:hypothetical protein